MNLCIYVSIYTYMCVCAYVYIYIYIYMHHTHYTYYTCYIEVCMLSGISSFRCPSFPMKAPYATRWYFWASLMLSLSSSSSSVWAMCSLTRRCSSLFVFWVFREHFQGAQRDSLSESLSLSIYIYIYRYISFYLSTYLSLSIYIYICICIYVYVCGLLFLCEKIPYNRCKGKSLRVSEKLWEVLLCARAHESVNQHIPAATLHNDIARVQCLTWFG